MENKMKWDRSKKKKFPDIEIEMSNTHYNGNDEKIKKDETPIQMIPLWSKQNADLASPNLGIKEHSFIIQSGDSGIESVQVCYKFIFISVKKMNKLDNCRNVLYEFSSFIHKKCHKISLS